IHLANSPAHSRTSAILPALLLDRHRVSPGCRPSQREIPPKHFRPCRFPALPPAECPCLDRAPSCAELRRPYHPSTCRRKTESPCVSPSWVYVPRLAARCPPHCGKGQLQIR